MAEHGNIGLLEAPAGERAGNVCAAPRRAAPGPDSAPWHEGVAVDGCLLSIVAPAYNEQECLGAFVERADAVLDRIGVPGEILIVNDGSRDNTLAVALGLTARYGRLRVVNLSRNFGHEMASSAGISQARGKAVVLIDSDLQDPPEVIPQLLARWREGFQVVYAQRRQRDGETVFKRATSWLFYRLMRRGTGLDLPTDTGDFRLLDRSVVDAFLRMPERHRFVRGMIAWMGFRQSAVGFDRDRRHGGVTKYNVGKLVSLTIDSMLGYTVRPLRWATMLGLTLFLFGMLGCFYVLVQKLFPVLGELVPWLGVRMPGYALLMCSVFLMLGVQSLMIGILGEYVGRIYEQVQGRPLYLIEGVYDRTTARQPEDACSVSNLIDNPTRR